MITNKITKITYKAAYDLVSSGILEQTDSMDWFVINDFLDFLPMRPYSNLKHFGEEEL